MILAVYGTLRRGGCANDLLRRCKWLGTDRINGKLSALGDLPCLKLTGNSDKDPGVLVDMYQLPEDHSRILTAIDRYEGFYPKEPDQSLYSRRVIITKEGCCPVVVYEYKFEAHNGTTIPSGDWLEYTSSEH